MSSKSLAAVLTSGFNNAKAALFPSSAAPATATATPMPAATSPPAPVPAVFTGVPRGMYCCVPPPVNMVDEVVAERRPVPLKSQTIKGKMNGCVGIFTKTDEYVNDLEDKAMDMEYVFPLNVDSAMNNFSALINGKLLIANLKPKETAEQDFKTAVAAGKTAAIVTSSAPNVFKIKIGNIPPKATIITEICFSMPLKCQGGSYVLNLPTAVPLKYTPKTSSATSVSLMSDKPVHTTGKVEYKVALELEYSATSKIVGVMSTTHPKDLNFAIEQKEKKTLKITNKNQLEAQEDLCILIETAEPYGFHVCIDENTVAGKTVNDVMVSFTPNFPIAQQKKTEIIPLIDLSGSMFTGNEVTGVKGNNDHACDATIMLINQLRTGMYFNICGFGSSYGDRDEKGIERGFMMCFKDGSKPYNTENKVKALKWVEEIRNKNLSGTEFIPPLKYLFDLPRIAGYTRQLIPMTDGQSNGAAEIAQIAKLAKEFKKRPLIQKNDTDVKASAVSAAASSKTELPVKDADSLVYGRVFCLGIGTAAEQNLLKQVSEAGDGTYIIAVETKKLDNAVAMLFRNALQPTILEPKIQWFDTTGKEMDCVKSPSTFKSVFREEGMLAFASFTSDSKSAAQQIGKVVFTGVTNTDVPVRYEQVIDMKAAVKQCGIRSLVGKSLISELEEGRHPLASAMRDVQTVLIAKEQKLADLRSSHSAQVAYVSRCKTPEEITKNEKACSDLKAEIEAAKKEVEPEKKKVAPLKALYVAELVKQSLLYGVISQETSFVLVDPRVPDVILDKVSVNVPVQTVTGSGGLRFQNAQPQRMYAMAAACAAPAAAMPSRLVRQGTGCSAPAASAASMPQIDSIDACMDDSDPAAAACDSDDDSGPAAAAPAAMFYMGQQSKGASKSVTYESYTPPAKPVVVLSELEQLLRLPECDGNFTYDAVAVLLKLKEKKFDELLKKLQSVTKDREFVLNMFMVQYLQKKYTMEFLNTHSQTMVKLKEWLAEQGVAEQQKDTIETEVGVFVNAF